MPVGQKTLPDPVLWANMIFYINYSIIPPTKAPFSAPARSLIISGTGEFFKKIFFPIIKQFIYVLVDGRNFVTF
jgi:hypothetical protein